MEQFVKLQDQINSFVPGPPLLILLVTIGGIRSAARVAEILAPFMAVVIVLGFALVLLPAALALIVESAFNPEGAFGVAAGVSVIMVMRGGGAPIAAAAARTDFCVGQGLVAVTGSFFDSIFFCTMTGLLLVRNGAWNEPAMTNAAFLQLMNYIVGRYVVSVGLIFFAFTTILGWNYYGERCAEYLIDLLGLFGVIFAEIRKLPEDGGPSFHSGKC